MGGRSPPIKKSLPIVGLPLFLRLFTNEGIQSWQYQTPNPPGIDKQQEWKMN